MSKDTHTLAGWVIVALLLISGPAIGYWTAFDTAIYLGPLWLAYNQFWYLNPQNPGPGDLENTKGFWILFFVLLLVLPTTLYGRLMERAKHEKVKKACLMQTHTNEELLEGVDARMRSALLRQLEGARTPFSLRICENAGVTIQCDAGECIYHPPTE